MTANQWTVYQLYQSLLNRAPDTAGLAFWSARLGAGTSLATFATAIAGSQEFAQIQGPLTNFQFSGLLYNKLLAHATEPVGAAYWAGQLDAGMTRGNLVAAFFNSAEYQGALARNTDTVGNAIVTNNLFGATYGQIYRLDLAALNPTPSAATFEAQANAVAAGQSLGELATSLVNSTAFQAAYGALTNSQFVTTLYTNVLGRAVDAAGQTFWTGQLNGGLTRANMVSALAESAEFQGRTAGALNAFMQSSMTNWADLLDGAGGNDTLIGGRGADIYRFDRTQAGSDHVYGLEAWDILNFANFGYGNPGAATAKMTQSGADVVFSDQGETVTFHNTTLAVVSNTTFTFA